MPCWLYSVTSQSLSRLWAPSRQCHDAIYLCLFSYPVAPRTWQWPTCMYLRGLPVRGCRQLQSQVLEPQGNRIEVLLVVQERGQRKYRADTGIGAEGEASSCPDLWRVGQPRVSCLLWRHNTWRKPKFPDWALSLWWDLLNIKAPHSLPVWVGPWTNLLNS